MVFVTNLVTLLVFSTIGYSLDVLFNTKPFYLIACIISSFPMSIFLMIKKAQKLTNNIKLKNKNG